MKIGDVVLVERTSCDANGEIWKWEEVAIVVKETINELFMFTVHGEKFEITKKWIPKHRILGDTNVFFNKKPTFTDKNKIINKEIKMNYKLSDQAIGAIMMALQKSLMEQADIVPVFKNFEIQIDDSDHLVVMNPPTVKVDKLAEESGSNA